MSGIFVTVGDSTPSFSSVDSKWRGNCGKSTPYHGENGRGTRGGIIAGIVGSPDITWIFSLLGAVTIFSGFLLLALRKYITYIVLAGGMITALVLAIMLYNIINDEICVFGFFSGLAVYVIAWTYVAKRIILANAITCFAAGSFLLLFPFMFQAVYVFAVLWFVLTFVLFYLSVKSLRAIRRLFENLARSRGPED